MEHLKQGFKRKLSWNKYRSKGKAQVKSNNLDYMINPTVRNIDRLFDQSYKVGNKDPVRNYFVKYYLSLEGFKCFNVLIDNKPFLGQSVKNKQKVYENLVEMLRNNDDLVMLIYSLLAYSSNYSKNEAVHFNTDVANTDVFKSFKYKAKSLRNTVVYGAN